MSAVNGIATFSNLALVTGGNYTFRASATGLAAATSATVNVADSRPTASITGDTSGVRGQVRTFTLGVSYASQPSPAGNFTWSINWNDGSPLQTVVGLAGTQVTHKFAETGVYNISVTVANASGQTSPAVTQAITITAFAVQIDPVDGKHNLVVGSGAHDSEIEIERDCHGGLVVEIENRGTERDEVNVTVSGPVDRIFLYGQKSDELSVACDVKIDAVLHAGSGDSILQGGGGNNVLVGGAGCDILIGGGQRDLLIGGGGNDVIIAGSGDDILVGGSTNLDANDAALIKVLAEWTSSSSYALRIQHLTGAVAGGLNGSNFLNVSTVHADNATDLLAGGGGTDWFIAHTTGANQDILIGARNGETVTQN